MASRHSKIFPEDCFIGQNGEVLVYPDIMRDISDDEESIQRMPS